MPREADHSDLRSAKLTPLCLACGYDLRGTVSEICPECGVKFDPATNARLTQVPTVSNGHITAVLLLYPILSPILVFMPAALVGFVVGLTVFVLFNHVLFARACGLLVVLSLMVWVAGLFAIDLSRQKQRFLRYQNDYVSHESEPIRAGAYFAWLCLSSLVLAFLSCLPFL